MRSFLTVLALVVFAGPPTTYSRYQRPVQATGAGQVYHGVIVYESPESTLLQTGPDTTVRILNAERSSVRTSTQSLMPTGLLETLSDGDLSDLYAYLKTLGSK